MDEEPLNGLCVTCVNHKGCITKHRLHMAAIKKSERPHRMQDFEGKNLSEWRSEVVLSIVLD